jgi:hypothetical protein
MADLDPILKAAVTSNASDIYLIEGTPPTLKVDGVAAPLDGSAPLTKLDLQKLLILMVPEPQRKAFESSGEANLSYMHGTFGRFRLNCYRASARPAWSSGGSRPRSRPSTPSTSRGSSAGWSWSARGSSWWWAPPARASPRRWRR